MAAAEDPIEDTSFLGAKINEMCAGKDIYWMYPKQGDEEKAGQGDVTGRCIISLHRNYNLFLHSECNLKRTRRKNHGSFIKRQII